MPINYMSNPTNETLANMIGNLKETVEDGIKRTDEHFKKLNNKVGLNSDHRIAQKTHNNWIRGIIAMIVIPIAFLIFKSFF